jgi:hypothetical protein
VQDETIRLQPYGVVVADRGRFVKPGEHLRIGSAVVMVGLDGMVTIEDPGDPIPTRILHLPVENVESRRSSGRDHLTDADNDEPRTAGGPKHRITSKAHGQIADTAFDMDPKSENFFYDSSDSENGHSHSQASGKSNPKKGAANRLCSLNLSVGFALVIAVLWESL